MAKTKIIPSAPPKIPATATPKPEEKTSNAALPGALIGLIAIMMFFVVMTIILPPLLYKPAEPPKEHIAKWVHGWTDETTGRMKTMPTTVAIGKGIINFSYTYGKNKKGRGAGTLQADGAYAGTWSDSCGSGTFWLKPEGNANHYTGWQTGNKYPGKKFPMFLMKVS